MRHVPDMAETCKGILDAVMDEIEADNCSLMFEGPALSELSIRAARGGEERRSVYYPDHYLIEIRSDSNQGGNCRVGFERGQAVMVNDVDRNPVL